MAKEKKIISETGEEPAMIPSKVGDILLEARKKQKKDLDKIVAVLRIRRIYLEALENSDYKAFPGFVYAIGFLRNYAKYLGLDAESLVRAYQEETAFLKPNPTFIPDHETHLFLPKMKYLGIVAFLIALVGIGTYFLTYQKKQEKEEKLLQLVQEVPVGVVQEETQPTEPTVASENERTTTETGIQEAVSAPESTTRIRFVATDETWIEIQDEDTILVSKVLKKGDSYDVPENSENMRLKSGNAGGLEVYVDGQKVAPLGKAGAVVSKVVLDPETLKNR